MEAAVTESAETNNMDSSLPEELPKEVVGKMGVPEVVQNENELAENEKNDSERQLSWEKIAAEIVAEEVDEPKEKEPEAEQVTQPVEPELTVSNDVKLTEEDAVIDTVTEENTLTEVETVTSEVVAEQQTEEVVSDPPTLEPQLPIEPTEALQPAETPPPAEAPTPVEAALPVTEVAAPVEVAVPAAEVTAEFHEETFPVDEVVEAEMVEDSEPVSPKIEQAEKEEIEITEVSEKAPESAIPVDDLEYTVLEAEDVETNEIIEEHLAQTAGETVSETVVIINPDQSQTEITIQQVDDDTASDNSQSYTEEIYLVTKENESESVDDPLKAEAEAEPAPPKPKKQRGRKPIADIPLHVLGRDISKPTEGVSNGGRTMPKPRLGVKVPYRNLTSQIVSKQEIEKEIMDRFKLKQEQSATNSGDVLFARKLTQRLAKKLIPTEKEKEKKSAESSEAGSSQIEAKPSEIRNNSDLIAILEGEDDDLELSKLKVAPKEVAKKTEKEIALEQLKELPGKNKIFKSKNEEEKKAPSPQKEAPKVKSPAPSPQKSPEKKNLSEMEPTPRLKTGMVIKTYTRKRKSTDLDLILPPKKTVVTTATIKSEDGGTPGTVYVTKSSRVIKRKVIWDPDEVPNKSPIKALKMEPTAKSPVKPAERKEPEKSPEKRTPSGSPVKKMVSKVSPLKKPKRLTEVDKLLMDEGAVNMLYEVKTNDDNTSLDKLKKKNKNVISLDRAHKELMSKTNVIKNDLQQNTTKEVQKSLRKKEIVSPNSKKEVKKETTPSPVTRKKSKDSAKSSVHSPPSSPPYNAAEASRIIRRHSSSSFSSNYDDDDDDSDEKVPKKKATKESSKKAKKVSETKPAKEAKNNNNTVNESKANHVDKAPGQYKTFTVAKKNKLAAIKLQNVDGKCYLNEQVLKELTSCLKEFGKDDDCHVVSITSDSNESFCQGLDYRLLVADDDGARKKKATEMANLVKEFLRCLLNFPKVLVAGIQGDCVGLGVTMLPLFDMVVASDTSTFSTPYARLDCVPEAGFLLAVPFLSSNGLASELLFASQTVKADDAFRRGLVTRLCWPEKYQQELKGILSEISSQSVKSIIASKEQLRQNMLQTTESALSSINKVLVECWTRKECQKNFSK